MSMLLKEAIKYVSKLLACEIEYEMISFPKTLPYYFTSSYKIAKINILSLECYIVIDNNNLSIKTSQLIKRLALLSNELKNKLPVVYCSNSMDWYTRDKFIRNNISFLVPGIQMYIPFLGVAFIEKFNTTIKESNTLSPSTQYLFFQLLMINSDKVKLGDFVDSGLSKMSISRALNEMYRLGIIKKIKKGNSIEWLLKERKELLWKKTKDYFFNPIQVIEYVDPKSYNIEGDESFLLASESALSEESMLGIPDKNTYAISNREWLKVKDQIKLSSETNDDSVRIEVWKHKIPKLNDRIHPLALVLTLSDVVDERIQICLEELYENYDWSI